MTDIHYELRASERDFEIPSYKKLVTEGRLVEKRKKFFRGPPRKCYYYKGAVHIFEVNEGTLKPKRVTIMPYSKRKWKFVK